MKTVSKILLILSLGCCLVGAILLGIGSVLHGWDYAKNTNLNTLGYQNQDLSQSFTQTDLPLDGFSSIDIELSLIDLNILPSADGKATLSYTVEAGNYSKDPITYTCKNDKLVIREKDRTPSAVIQIDLSDLFSQQPKEGGEMTLCLPQEVYDSCILSMDVGTLYIEGLQAASGEISVDLGDAKLLDSTMQSGFVELDCGNLTLEQTDLSNAELHLDLGNLSLTDTALTDVEATLSCGNAEGTDVLPMGDISFFLDLGDLSLSCPTEQLKKLNVEATTDLGTIHLPDWMQSNAVSNFSQHSASAEGTLTMENSCGNITLTEAD